MKAIPGILLVCCTACSWFPCSAATVFTSSAPFLNAAGTLNFESFETFPRTDPSPPSLSSLVTNGFTLIDAATINSFDVWDHQLNSTPNGDATDGVKDIVWFANNPSTSLTFQFSSPVNAFGLTIVGYGLPANTSPLTFSTSSGEVGIAALGSQPASNRQYFGVIGAPFTSITFSRTNLGDAMSLDSVHYGLAVPEPPSMVFSLIAAVALIFYRKTEFGGAIRSGPRT
jgi:hypothetical protein